MPYLMNTHMGDAARKLAQTDQPFGPGVPLETARRCEKVEVHGSSFGDCGPDWCEFRLFGQDGQLLEKRRVDGY